MRTVLLQLKSEEVRTALETNTALEDCSIIEAYPYILKPVRLTHCVIAVSPCGYFAERASLGRGEYVGEYSVCADVFIPYNLGSPYAFDIIDEVVKTAQLMYASQVRASDIVTNDVIECFSIKCVFTFKGNANITEESDGE